ncbi:MAG: histidine phosphatase family protein [Bacilli bacterium]|nr:histidine phosphatase family protein [Bacilli bacterium]MCI8778184.1 histidine phosphatase family protein [Bacilli bacterium]
MELSKHKELQNIDELWSSNYVRAIEIAKYIATNNNIKLNISSSFDERYYGIWNNNIDKYVENKTIFDCD